MDDKQFLGSGFPPGGQGAGLFGRRLTSFHLQLETLLGREIGPDAALVFAEPMVSSDGDIDWYTRADGAIRPYARASEAERERAKARLADLYSAMRRTAERYLAASDPAQLQAGKLLTEALAAPREGETYLVGDHVVTISWACGADRDSNDPEILCAAAAVPASSSHLPPSPAPSQPPHRPPPAAVRWAFVVAGPRWFRRLFCVSLAVLALGVIASLARAYLGPQSARQLAALKQEQAALQSRLTALQNKVSDKSLQCDQLTFPSKLELLQGEWINRDQIELKGSAKNTAVSVIMKFDAQGKGELRMEHSPDICRAPFEEVQFVPNQSLRFRTGALQCTGQLGSVVAQEVSCAPGPDGLAVCHLLNIGGESYNAHFSRKAN